MKFELTESFTNRYKGKQPNWGPLGYITYKRTYARQISENRTEEFWQTLRRVVEGCYNTQLNHCKSLNLPWNAQKAQRSAQRMFELMWEFKFLPPGRGLWMMGTEYVTLRGGAALNNCAHISTENINVDFSEPFCFLADMSLVGVGVAFDTKGCTTIYCPTESDETFIIPDSKEGWVEAMKLTLDAYSVKNGKYPKFDFTQIRPSGAPIKTFGGIAPGPRPLVDCISNIHKILRKDEPYKITSVQIVDIMNVIGKCVVSGGVRRTAELALGDFYDADYAQMKDTKHPELLGWRWASNNSVIANVGNDYSVHAGQTAKNGEPGYFWLNNAREYGRLCDGKNYKDMRVSGTNPCAEQSLESAELCTLCETFPSLHDTYEEYKETLKYAYLYAKTVTLIPTHNPKTNAVMLRNRRIGLSQSGIIESFEKHGRRTHLNWCDEGYKYLSNLDKQYSEWMCVPESIKKTTVKPSGTVSLLPGVTPGVHYAHSEYYYRTIRVQNTSPLLEPLEKAGYRIEESVQGDNSKVVYFPVKEKYFNRSKDSVSIWEQLENAAQMQYYWSDNQVSVTVTFKPEEADQIKEALELYETRLKSVSFLPLLDHKYEQAPYITITKEEYEEATKNLRPLRLGNINTDEIVEAFCDGDKCSVHP